MERNDVNVHQMVDRLGDRFDDLRDRIAQGLSAESSEARRALDRSSDALDKLGDKLGTKLDGLTLETAKRFDRLESEVHADHGHGWVSRLAWMAAGVGLGAAAAYLMDPDVGRRRRHDLTDQVTSTAADLSDTARKRAEYAAGVAKGAAIESAKGTFGGHEPADPETLRQRIRSEVIGHLDGTDAVVIAVHDQGRVTLKGSVATRDVERTLVERTAQVPGVRTVETELDVAA